MFSEYALSTNTFHIHQFTAPPLSSASSPHLLLLLKQISKGAEETERRSSCQPKPPAPAMPLAEVEQWDPLQPSWKPVVANTAAPQGAPPPDFQFLSPIDVAVDR